MRRSLRGLVREAEDATRELDKQRERDGGLGVDVRLWEVGHPYHCSRARYGPVWEGSIRSSRVGDIGGHCVWKDLDEFLRERGHDDVDANLVVRWDWDTPESFHAKGIFSSLEAAREVWYSENPDRSGGELEIVILFQRKGALNTHFIPCEPTPENERKILRYLWKHWERVQQNWYPLSLRQPPRKGEV